MFLTSSYIDQAISQVSQRKNFFLTLDECYGD